MNKNTSGVDVWDNLPEVIRWILYIPLVLLITIVAAFLLHFLCIIRGDFEGIFLYLQITFNAGLCATLYVWLALNFAPRSPRACAWGLYSIWSIVVALSIFRFFAIAFIEEDMYIQQSDTLELLQGIGWFVAGIFSLIYFGRKYKNETSI